MWTICRKIEGPIMVACAAVIAVEAKEMLPSILGHLEAEAQAVEVLADVSTGAAVAADTPTMPKWSIGPGSRM